MTTAQLHEAVRPERLLALYIVFLARREDLLELETRRRLFRHVRDYPGLHLREIARQLGLDPNHVLYHLRYLEKRGHVSSRKDEGYLRFFPREEGSVGLREVMAPQQKQVLALLRQPVPLHATLLLLDLGEATFGGLLEKVQVAHATLHYHLKKMERAGVVRSRKEGRERYYALADHDGILGQLLRYRPPDALVQGFLEAWENLELDRE